MHNAPFDVGVLVANLGAYKMPPPDIRYFCTLELARVALPGMPNHRLGTLATFFGIPLQHHDAGSDAVACARLGILLTRLLDAKKVGPCLRDLADYAAGTAMRQASHGGSVRISLQASRDGMVRISLDGPDAGASDECGYDAIVANGAAPDNRFEGLRFVFTGELSFLTRSEATHIVEIYGGKVSGSVSAKTSCVVVGEAVWAARQRGGKTTDKLRKALQLQETAGKIRILLEPEFLKVCGYAGGADGVENLDSMRSDEEANRRHLGEI